MTYGITVCKYQVTKDRWMGKKSIPFEISTQTTLFDLWQQREPKVEYFWSHTQLLQYAESQCCIVVKSICNLKKKKSLLRKNYVGMSLSYLTNISLKTLANLQSINNNSLRSTIKRCKFIKILYRNNINQGTLTLADKEVQSIQVIKENIRCLYQNYNNKSFFHWVELTTYRSNDITMSYLHRKPSYTKVYIAKA
jgi:hypothetical protein